MYKIEFSKQAVRDIARLRKSEPSAFRKLGQLLMEIRQDPYTGTGHPEQLKGMSIPTWSRRISAKHRLVYNVVEDVVIVHVLSAYGHYNDK